MEKELNIAAILKDKPEGLKLWSDTFGVVYSGHIDDNCDFPISIFLSSQRWIDLTIDGRISNIDGTLPCIVPSKEMRDWEKFAWKKGDVLCSNTGDSCIFVKWISDDYTSFLGDYSTHKNYEKEECQTENWSKRTNKEDIEQYILAIEAVKNGTLNLSTLQIEPEQEFKDGDVLFVKTKDNEEVFIKKLNPKEKTAYYVSYNLTLKDFGCQWCKAVCREQNIKELRLATDSEKQQLISALAKEDKAWNPDTKQIEELPKKCEFKPMDWCLMKYKGHYNNRGWELCQYAYTEHRVSVCGDKKRDFYHAVGGEIYAECIPYNDSTKHLLGTNDEWKGGEV